jgi:hypothetical protein
VSKLPFGMYCNTNALKSMLEHALIICMRLRCRAMRSTRHSASKLQVVCSDRMSRTFTATTKPLLSWPLNTFPNPPEPSMLSSLKLSVARTSSRWEINWWSTCWTYA